MADTAFHTARIIRPVLVLLLALAPAQSSQAGPSEEARQREIGELRRQIEDLQRRLEAIEREPARSEPPRASATQMPNLSLFGNLIFGAGDSRRVPNRGRSNLQELEVSLQDRVAPKWRYDVFLAAAKEEEWGIGMEEGYVTGSALLPGVTLKAGRLRTPIGKFNALHPHSWSFITVPSAIASLLGPEGLNSDGALVQYLLPTGETFVQLELGIWQTTSETEDGLGFGAGDEGAFSGRVWTSKEVGTGAELELGISRYQGRGTVGGMGRLRKSLNSADLTLRGTLGEERRYRLSAEVFDHETDGPGGRSHRLGGFGYGLYRWNRFWEAGIRGDYTRIPFPVDGVDYGGSLFLTRYLTEQTSMRLEYQYQKSPLLGSGSGFYFQLLFGSGPHTHQLQ